MVEKLFFSSWWVILYLLTAGFFYEKGLLRLESELALLEEKRASLIRQKERAQERRALLKRETDSFSDPEWIELTLIRCLGVVPEGFQKIYFPHGD